MACSSVWSRRKEAQWRMKDFIAAIYPFTRRENAVSNECALGIRVRMRNDTADNNRCVMASLRCVCGHRAKCWTDGCFCGFCCCSARSATAASALIWQIYSRYAARPVAEFTCSTRHSTSPEANYRPAPTCSRRLSVAPQARTSSRTIAIAISAEGKIPSRRAFLKVLLFLSRFSANCLFGVSVANEVDILECCRASFH